MPKYRIDLVAKLIGFHELVVEADNEYEAKKLAREEGQKLADDVSNWDVQCVEYHNTPSRDGVRTVYEVDVNDCREV